MALSHLNKTVLAIDLLLHISMNLLHDEFFEQLLRLCGSGLVAYSATAPNCGLYSLLRPRPGGPRALRTRSELDGIAGLSAYEATQLQESSLLLVVLNVPLLLIYRVVIHILNSLVGL